MSHDRYSTLLPAPEATIEGAARRGRGCRRSGPAHHLLLDPTTYKVLGLRSVSSFAGYRVNRYGHSLQSASRAYRDGRGEEYVVAALLHDLGDELAPWTHGEMVGTILEPYVSAEICWSVSHHGIFQLYCYGHFVGEDRDARDRYRDHPYFAACAEFCER